MNLTNFAEQFASKVLTKSYQDSIVGAITNTDYQGEIKKAGDRVNILSFLNMGELNDYSVGTDMAVGQLVDTEDQLVVEKRKYYNFALDQIEELFTYATDIPSFMINEHSKVLERVIDTYILDKAGQEAKAGNWVGVNLLVVGGANTNASLVTSATGGTLTVDHNNTVVSAPSSGTTIENPLDGNLYLGGFETSDLYKGVRLSSTRAFVTPWYRISGITATNSVTITEWDEATSGPDFEENYTLRGTFGGDGVNFPKNGAGDASFVGLSGLGYEIQAAIATSITSGSIYNQVTVLAQYLDENEVPNEGRHFTVPPSIVTQFKQSSALQPTGIAEIYTGNVIQGRVMRVGAFDIHEAVGSRISTRAGHTVTVGVDSLAPTTGATGYLLLANELGFMTYADKWSESRVMGQINQFAKNYQGLFLFGAKVPKQRRKRGAILFGSV